MFKNRKLVSIVALCLIAALCLTACGGNQTAGEDQTASEGYTFTDALGQEITVNNPQRVVSLMGSFSEVWVLAGGADT